MANKVTRNSEECAELAGHLLSLVKLDFSSFPALEASLRQSADRVNEMRKAGAKLSGDDSHAFRISWANYQSRFMTRHGG